MKKTLILAGLLAAGLGIATGNAAAANVQVTITNNADADGTYLTPAWFGFHDGNFDVFSPGISASSALESLAEDGSTALLDAAFTAAQASGISGQANGGPLAPSGSSTTVFNNLSATDNNWFSFASMVIPSSDYFVGNADPQIWNISSVINGTQNSLTFNVFSVYDAGTEVNDFNTSAANSLIAGLPTGQGNNTNVGADQGGFITQINGSEFDNFANIPQGFDITAFDFNQPIATIQISAVAAVPEPETYAMFLAGLGLIGFMGNKQRNKASS